MSQKKLESAKNVLFMALAIDMAVTALVIIADVWAVGAIKDIRSGASTIDQSTLGTIDFWDSFAKVMILTVIGVGIALVRWLGACYEYAKETLKVSGLAQEGWKTLGWVIPIMNLFKPYQVLSEIYKAGASDYAGGTEWKKSSGSWLLLFWWIFWIIAHLILWGIAKQNLRSSFRDDLTLNQIISMSYGGIVICAISLIVAGLWFVVAGSLTRRLLGRSAPVVTMTAPGNTESSANIEDQIYAKIADELDGGDLDKATWTKAYAASDGDDKKARSAYIKLRFERLVFGWEEARLKVEAELPRQAPPIPKILVEDEPMERTAKVVIGIGVLVVVLIIAVASSQPSTNQGAASRSERASMANQPAVEAPAAQPLPLPEAPAPVAAPPVDAEPTTQPASQNTETSQVKDHRGFSPEELALFNSISGKNELPTDPFAKSEVKPRKSRIKEEDPYAAERAAYANSQGDVSVGRAALMQKMADEDKAKSESAARSRHWWW